jgi:hypothetical protein
MTHDELIAKAIEQLRKSERAFERSDKVPPEIRRLKADEMHRRTIRDAVFIRFEADDERGCIEITLDTQTGEALETKFIPPKKKTDANAA